jgi:LysR family glycine cleavage system transcriptional activator
MRVHLPSMTSLRAFEAAVRHSSFSRAARELNLTQTAISHAIKNLEGLLGAKLFVREGNAIRLTDVGHDYIRTVRAMLIDISEATGRAMHHRSDKALFIGCLPAFGMKRLMPNLGEFCSKHPEIAIRFWTVLTSDSFSRRDYDVAILYGAGDWPGCVAHKISDEEIFPVCSPKLMRRQPRLRKPSDLSEHTVVRTAFSFILQDDWPLWLEAAGEKDLQFANEITCDLLLPTLQAAIEGLGVALGRSPLVSAELASKALVEPFSIRITSKSAFYVVSPRDRADLPNVQLFRNWALGRFGARKTANAR